MNRSLFRPNQLGPLDDIHNVNQQLTMQHLISSQLLDLFLQACIKCVVCAQSSDGEDRVFHCLQAFLHMLVALSVIRGLALQVLCR